MKTCTVIFRLLLSLVLMVGVTNAFAGRIQTHISHNFAGKDRPKIRTEAVLCFADKEAGYAELYFKADLGELQITIRDSKGNTVAETTIDSNVEDFANLTIPTSNDSYNIEILGEEYYGQGEI